MTVVGRPRLAAVLLWCALPALGVFALVRTSGGVSRVLGVFFVLLGLLGLVSAARSRVWVDGAVLRHRTLFTDRTVRLDRLTTAHLTNFDRANGRQLRLVDAAGGSTVIDATNLRLKPLYVVLAEHVRPDSPAVNDRLRRRMVRY